MKLIDLIDPSNTKQRIARYKEKMNELYQKYVNDIDNENFDSEIFKVFLNNQNDEYNKGTKTKRKVIDFIAGMTDDYFINEYNKYFK